MGTETLAGQCHRCGVLLGVITGWGVGGPGFKSGGGAFMKVSVSNEIG